MQKQLASERPDLKIQILGLNERGHEIGNSSITEGRELPWLQDVDADSDGASDVWLNAWDYVYRDVVIVDADNTPVATFNVTDYNLADPTNYETLFDMMVDAAESESNNPYPWQNPDNPLDVDGDSFIVPLDVLHVLNELNSGGARALDASATDIPYYYDTNGDGFLAPLDALLILNYLNDPSNLSAEGEPDGAAAAAAMRTMGGERNVQQHEKSGETKFLAIDSLFADDQRRAAVDLSLAALDELEDSLRHQRRENHVLNPIELHLE